MTHYEDLRRVRREVKPGMFDSWWKFGFFCLWTCAMSGAIYLSAMAIWKEIHQ